MFLIGLAAYAMTKKWQVAVVIPCVLFVIITFIGDSEKNALIFTLTFGLPLVFSAGLLGAYVYQTRIVKDDEPVEDAENKNASDLNNQE